MVGSCVSVDKVLSEVLGVVVLLSVAVEFWEVPIELLFPTSSLVGSLPPSNIIERIIAPIKMIAAIEHNIATRTPFFFFLVVDSSTIGADESVDE